MEVYQGADHAWPDSDIKTTAIRLSLVIPVRNEENSIKTLLESVGLQTFAPDEIIIVDGGSTDATVAIVERLAAADTSIKLIRTDGATPGKGRNLGIAAARNEWIALTDAGIILEPEWLERLIDASVDSDIVYGDFAPLIGSSFDKSAAISYVAAARPGLIRGRSIASCLLRKDAWTAVGGFPDLRAAEDLLFMDALEAGGFRIVETTLAMVKWQLRSGWRSTFTKFVIYSQNNVWAGKQSSWQHAVARQYAAMLIFALASVLFSWLWILAIPIWLGARTGKRILSHRYEFGVLTLFDPLVFIRVLLMGLTIDLAMFWGWVRAIAGDKNSSVYEG
jgi:glycosyltransferase involved in cell wall biosynthesis